ncbi:hypothetical protein C0J52_18012, partial [Blattella germanica]
CLINFHQILNKLKILTYTKIELRISLGIITTIPFGSIWRFLICNFHFVFVCTADVTYCILYAEWWNIIIIIIITIIITIIIIIGKKSQDNFKKRSFSSTKPLGCTTIEVLTFEYFGLGIKKGNQLQFYNKTSLF